MLATAPLYFCSVVTSVFQKPAMSSSALLRAARSEISPHTSVMASFTLETIPLKMFSMPSEIPSPMLARSPIVSVTLRAATTAESLAAPTPSMPVCTSRSPSAALAIEFRMLARVSRALSSFVSHLAISSALSAYFSWTSFRASVYVWTIFSCSAICFCRLLTFAAFFSCSLAFFPSSAVSAFSRASSVFSSRSAFLIACRYSFSPCSSIFWLIPAMCFTPSAPW